MPMPAVEQSSFVEYAQVLWRRRWVVVGVVIAALAVSLLYSAVAPKRYDATAALLLEPSIPSTVLQAEDPVANGAPVDVLTDVQIIASNEIASAVRKAVGSAPSVTATEVGTTDVVNVTVSAAEPKLAARAANAYVSAYIALQHHNISASLSEDLVQLKAHLASIQSAISTVSAEISAGAANNGVEAELAGVQSALEVEQSSLQSSIGTYATYLADESVEGGQLITPATTPTHKSSPKTTEYAVFALLIGLVLGIALALALEIFSRPPAVTHGADSAVPPDNRVGGSAGLDATPQSPSPQVPTPV